MNKKGIAALGIAAGVVTIVALAIVVGAFGSRLYGELVAPPINPDAGAGPDGNDPECFAIANACEPVVNNSDPDPDPENDANDGDLDAHPDADVGPFVSNFYVSYVGAYVKPSGAVLSNVESVGWCPNGCIGCGEDLTSEAWGRLIKVAADYGDRAMVNRELQFFKETMRHPEAGFAMWKLNPDGTSGSCGGQNSAIDAEMLAAEGLFIAELRWGTDPSGKSYEAWAMEILESIKPALIDGLYLPHCAYPAGSEARACERRSFLGYDNLRVLKKACQVDDSWCPIHDANKELMIGAVQNGGIYSVYYHDTNTYTLENADIHNNWALKHLAMDGDADAWAAVRPMYDEARTTFMANRAQGKSEICQQFDPGSGCKMSNPPQRVYAHWLEISSHRCAVTDSSLDCDFRDELIEVLVQKHKQDSHYPLIAPDNFGNIVVMEAYAEALTSGAAIVG